MDDRVAAVLLLVAAAALFVPDSSVERAVYPVTAHIGSEEIAMTVDTASMDFGRVPPRATVTKQLVIQNSGERRVVATITANGTISPHLSYPETISVPPNTTETVSVALKAESASPGTYTGYLAVEKRIR